MAIGFTIAYVLSPAVDALQRLRMGRVLAASTLYLLITILCVVGVVLLLPAIGRQSADFFSRTIEDIHYLDRNGNAVLDPDEPRLLRHPGTPVVFFEDGDGDGLLRNGQQTWGSKDFAQRAQESGVRVQPSLVKYCVAWIDATQGQFEQWLGRDLGQRGQGLLDVYIDHTQASRQALQDGLAVAESATTNESALLTWLNQPAPAGQAEEWNPSWSGADVTDITAAAEQVPAALRARWQRTMVAWGEELSWRHSAFVQALLRGDEGAVADSLLATDVRAALELVRSLEYSDEVAALYEQLVDSSRVDDQELLRAVYVAVGSADESAMQQALRSAYDGARAELTAVPDLARSWAASMVSNAGQFAGIALDIILIPIYAFFLTLGMPGVRRVTKRYVPVWQRERSIRLIRDIEKVVAAFFRGRLIVCILCSGLCYLGFYALSVPYAGLLSVAIGLATTIPLAGLLFLVPAVLLTLVDGGDALALRASLVVMVYGVVQTLEAVVLTPTIMGHEVELHPVVLILALLLCGSLLGVLGLILAVPIAATVRILAREFLLPRIRQVAHVPATGRFTAAESAHK